MPFYLRIQDDGRAAVCESESSDLNVPSHLGKVWLDGDLICLHFPSIDEITIAGRPPLQIVSHVIRLPADEGGVATVEAILNIRQTMMKPGNEALLLAFAEHGTDHSAIRRLYNEALP